MVMMIRTNGMRMIPPPGCMISENKEDIVSFKCVCTNIGERSIVATVAIGSRTTKKSKCAAVAGIAVKIRYSVNTLKCFVWMRMWTSILLFLVGAMMTTMARLVANAISLTLIDMKELQRCV